MVRDVLEAGMADSAEAYYIRTWFVGDPLIFTAADTPLGVLIPGNVKRVDQYVQEDTRIDPITVHLFPHPVDRVGRESISARDSITAMIDRVMQLVRRDPSLGARVYDVEVLGSVNKQPGFVGNDTLYSAEIQLQVKQRVLWNEY